MSRARSRGKERAGGVRKEHDRTDARRRVPGRAARNARGVGMKTIVGQMGRASSARDRRSAPGRRDLTVCPHCWMVNPGPCRLCGRCGADVETVLQESGGLRRTPAVQSPVPVFASGRLSRVQRIAVLAFVVLLALGYLVQLVPSGEREGAAAEPAPAGGR